MEQKSIDCLIRGIAIPSSKQKKLSSSSNHICQKNRLKFGVVLDSFELPCEMNFSYLEKKVFLDFSNQSSVQGH